MEPIENKELVTQVIQEVANTAPEGWRKLVYYQELAEDTYGTLRNKSTGKCWHGNEMLEYSRPFEIGSSMEAFEAVEQLYEYSNSNEKVWKGILVTIFEDGDFSVDFFYDSTPLLDGNRYEVDIIIDGAC
jgi:hypothetical protein